MLEVPIVGRRYRHFKGSVYLVKDIVRHVNTHEMMVIYSLEGIPELTHARPLSEWDDRIGTGGKVSTHSLIKRFTLIEEETTVKTITAYKTSDGRIFENEEEAGEHEAEATMRKELTVLFSEKTNLHDPHIEIFVDAVLSSRLTVKTILSKERWTTNVAGKSSQT